MQSVADLHDVLAAACPITGVSVGNWSDKTTWRVDHAPNATAAQIAAAQTALSNFSPNAPSLEDKIAAGCQIVSTATAALNGTYALDDLSRMDVIAIETSLNAGKGFPGGLTSNYGYPDINGQKHVFPAASDFTNFAAAIRDYYSSLRDTAYTLSTGGTASWPAQPATIP